VLARAAIGPEQQRGLVRAWEATLATSSLPVAGLDLVPPKPRYAMAAPLGAAVPGEAELLDVWLTERVPRWRVWEALEGHLPDGFRLVELFDVWLGEAPLPGQVVASVYRATVAQDIAALRAAAEAVRAAPSLPRVRRKGDTNVSYDLRPFLDGLDIDVPATGEGAVIRMTLRHDPEKGVGRPEEALAELGERVGTPLDVRSLVRERLVLSSDRGPA
jgi:hypothetical protein